MVVRLYGPGMARTPLAAQLQRAAAGPEQDERRTDRRRFLRDAGALAITATAVGRLAPSARGAVQPKIVVVGAGLAGLTCAYRLKQAGLRSRDPRGRRTASAAVAGRSAAPSSDGQIAEHGGELIDHGPSRATQPREGARRSTPIDLLEAEANGHRRGLLLRRRALLATTQATTTSRPSRQKLDARPERRELPDALRQLHAARVRARPHVDRRLDRGERPGRNRLAVRAAARRRLQHRVRRRVERSERAQPRLPARLRDRWARCASSASPTSSYHVVGGNDQVAAGLAARWPLRSRPAPC